jgi:hypothetical protein
MGGLRLKWDQAVYVSLRTGKDKRKLARTGHDDAGNSDVLGFFNPVSKYRFVTWEGIAASTPTKPGRILQRQEATDKDLHLWIVASI